MIKKIITSVTSIILCLALTVPLAVSLTGCSSGSSNVASKSAKLETGDIGQDSIVIVVGKKGVKYSEVMAYGYLLKQQYEGEFTSQLWDYKVDDGTIGDEAKREIVNTITEMKIIGIQAAKQKVKLNGEEKDEARQKADNIIKLATDEEKEKYGLTSQIFSDIYKDNILAEKMFYINTDEADTQVSDEEAATSEEKEAVIKNRQNTMFKEKYTEWSEKCEVKISDAFWNVFEL